MEVKKNTVLITGGATGIGYALAECFLMEGNEVIVCGRREQKLLEVQQKHPEIHVKVCDVTKESDRKELLEWVKSNFNELNILVNNAGVQKDIDFTKGIEDLENGESEIKVNLEAPIYLSAHFIPFLLSKKEAAIINVSSGLGFFPAKGMPVYSATKAAMHMLSITLRQQLAETSIKIFEVIPPMILDTELNVEGRAKRQTGRINMEAPTSAEFAAAVVSGIKGDIYEIGYGMTEKWIKASRA